MVSKKKLTIELNNIIEVYSLMAKSKSRFSEEDVQTKLIKPLFRALGWEIENPDEMIEQKVLGSRKRCDLIFRINYSNVMVVESKKLSIDLDKNKKTIRKKALQQAITYGHSAGVSITILTNFRKLIFLDTQKEYEKYEEAVVWELDYNQLLTKSALTKLDFFSKKGLKTNLWEEWLQQTPERGLVKEPIDKQLLKEILNWRYLLYKSIKEKYNNKFSKEKIDEFIQVLLNRFIFIRKCEDKGFFQNKYLYSLHFDFSNRKMKHLFTEVGRQYDGLLFEKHGCDEIIINNQVLGEIIFKLYYSEDRKIKYNFAAITSDVLGKMYEQYLGNIVNERGVTTFNPKQKEGGVYYTEPFIVNYMVNISLGRYLETAKDRYNITILDPSCGSGSFLLGAYDFLEKYLLQKNNINYRQKFNIIRTNLYGVDKDTRAIEISRLNLHFKLLEKGKKLPSNDNLKVGDSLIDDKSVAGEKAFEWYKRYPEIEESEGFDVIIGNPPYLRADFEDTKYQIERNWMENSDEYETLYEKWDLYIAFIERSLKLLKKGGILSFIISNSFNTSKYADKIKEYIFTNFHVVQVDFFKNVELFKGVGVENVIITIEKIKSNKKTVRILHEDFFNNKTKLRKLNDPKKVFRFEDEISFENKFNNTELLGDICYISKGMVIHSEETKYKGEFTKNDLLSDKFTKKNKKKYVEAKFINRYGVHKIKYLEWGTSRSPKKLSRPTFPELYACPKIIRGTTVEGTYDSSGLFTNHSINVMVRYYDLKHVKNRSINNSIKKWTLKSRKNLEKISSNYNLKYILAILNSKFAKFYLNTIRRHRLQYYFYSDDFKKLPIKKANKKVQTHLSKLVDKMLELNKQYIKLRKDEKKEELLKIRDEIDLEINNLVYDLYDLSKDEKNIIEQSLSKN